MCSILRGIWVVSVRHTICCGPLVPWFRSDCPLSKETMERGVHEPAFSKTLKPDQQLSSDSVLCLWFCFVFLMRQTESAVLWLSVVSCSLERQLLIFSPKCLPSDSRQKCAQGSLPSPSHPSPIPRLHVWCQGQMTPCFPDMCLAVFGYGIHAFMPSLENRPYCVRVTCCRSSFLCQVLCSLRSGEYHWSPELRAGPGNRQQVLSVWMNTQWVPKSLQIPIPKSK